MPGAALHRRNTAASGDNATAPTHMSPAATMSTLMNKMKTRPKPDQTRLGSLTHSAVGSGHPKDTARSMQRLPMQEEPMREVSTMNSTHMRSRRTTGSLRAFRLQVSAVAGGMNRRGDVLTP